jgi:integrase
MFTTANFDITGVRLPEARKQNRYGQARHLTEKDLVEIFNHLPDAKWRCVFAIAYFTGSRIGEVLKLRVDDIEGDRVLFRAENTKTKKTRVAVAVPSFSSSSMSMPRLRLATYSPPIAPVDICPGNLPIRPLEQFATWWGSKE